MEEKRLKEKRKRNKQPSNEVDTRRLTKIELSTNFII